MSRGRKISLAVAWLGLGLWFAAILAPAPAQDDLPGASFLTEAQRVLRLLALATSEGGLAMMPQAAAWLGERPDAAAVAEGRE